MLRHLHPHRTEHMLDSRAHLRIRPVQISLPLRQLFRARPLVIDARLETAFAQLFNPILRAIRTVRPNLSVPSRTVGQKLPKYLTVVAARLRHLILVNEFRVAVHRHMVLVAAIGLAALLRPARIGVFLPQLVRLPLSLLRHLARLHRRMVLATVALARHLHDQRGC